MLNGELYFALLAYILVKYAHRQYFLKDWRTASFKHIHKYWDDPICEYE